MQILIDHQIEKKKEIIFWGKNIFFNNTLDFNEKEAEQHIKNLDLDEEEKIQFINEFIDFYIKNPHTDANQFCFDKSLFFIEKLYNITEKEIYNNIIFKIEDFKKKENFEIFYYFRKFEFLHSGYNNIFREVFNWLSYNSQTIEKLIDKDKSSNNIISKHSINNQIVIMGTSGTGKSAYIKRLLLNKNNIIMKDKFMSLAEFKEEDKDYFYNILTNLTKEKKLANFWLIINNNKKDIRFKGVALYLEKKLNYEYLDWKLKSHHNNKSNAKEKKIKI